MNYHQLPQGKRVYHRVAIYWGGHEFRGSLNPCDFKRLQGGTWWLIPRILRRLYPWFCGIGRLNPQKKIGSTNHYRIRGYFATK